MNTNCLGSWYICIEVIHFSCVFVNLQGCFICYLHYLGSFNTVRVNIRRMSLNYMYCERSNVLHGNFGKLWFMKFWSFQICEWLFIPYNKFGQLQCSLFHTFCVFNYTFVVHIDTFMCFLKICAFPTFPKSSQHSFNFVWLLSWIFWVRWRRYSSDTNPDWKKVTSKWTMSTITSR